MKKHQFKLKQILFIGILLGITTFFAMCELEHEILNDENALNEPESSSLKSSAKNGCEIMELSYVIETSTQYISEKEKFSDIDIAIMTPKNNKEKISIKLFENGQIAMTIEKLTPQKEIKIPHKTGSDNSNQLYKTIIENNRASFYSKSGELLNSINMELPDHSETANRLLELKDSCYSEEKLNQAIAKLQGGRFTENLENYVKNAQNNGAQIMEENERLITIRLSAGQLEPGLTDEIVVLIDKKLNRAGGTRIYNESGELLSNTLFGYGPPEKPFLTAIKQQVKETLPSGNDVTVESLSKIDNIKFKLNI